MVWSWRRIAALSVVEGGTGPLTRLSSVTRLLVLEEIACAYLVIFSALVKGALGLADMVR